MAGSSANGSHLLLWAKLDRQPSSPPDYHPLICHLIDAASVAFVLWDTALPPTMKARLTSALGLSGREDAARRWIAFITGLHDIGKASPAFQLQDDATRQFWAERLRSAGLRWATPVPHVPHGAIGAAILPEVLEPFIANTQLATRLATLLGGHHGTFPSSRSVLEVSREAKGPETWRTARTQLAQSLADLLQLPPDAKPTQLDISDAMTLAGLVSVADWIASDKERFPYCPQIDSSSLAEYFDQSVRRAKKSVEDLNWAVSKPLDTPLDFRTLFPTLKEPNDLQAQTIQVAERLLGPSLVIVEAPMGEGKTEAAMYLARHWEQVDGIQGCYFALPTQATSNQMFSRVREYLTTTYPKNDAINLQLLHGHAALSQEFESLKEGHRHLVNPSYSEGHSHDEDNVVAAEWFTYRKRGLLSPFGVGTIDQALLSVLQTKHVFVRLFGLSSKTVIIDEVHAYDTYMTTLLERLLEWLAALGSPVVMLSATLPRERRDRLLTAYAKGLGNPVSFPPEATLYPRITWLDLNQAQGRHVETSARSSKHLRVEWIDGSLPAKTGDTFVLGKRLSQALDKGGCAAVICNTVRRAQAVFQELKTYFPETASDGAPELDLLHSQFLFQDREDREKRTLRRFGKPTAKVNGQGNETYPVQRPTRAILVATQVIEQSLDLDFDLMVSDMAPVDFLLQRAGRLHRHERPQRPPGLESPRLLVSQPPVQDGVPQFDRGDAAVYDPYVLLRSWLALQGRAAIEVPRDVEALIEAVYGEGMKAEDQTLAIQEMWRTTVKEMEAKTIDERTEAENRWVKGPLTTNALWRLTEFPQEEDAPEFHQAYQALTRLTGPNVQVVFLDGTSDSPCLDLERSQTFDMGTTYNLEIAKRLLMRSVTISDRRVVYQLRKQPVPPTWRRLALLRNHRLCITGQTVGSHVINVDKELGVIVS
ncbi:MAG: CRISPR-associated helicase Cas3' [Dehalococcoidia bacterium]|nr:CRISPR-associated helicase Cas3' [Dehalococcoidia bacterium]